MTDQPHRLTPLVILFAAWLFSLPGAQSAPAGTPVEERLGRVKAEIATLKLSVGRGDKVASEKAASSIERELTALHDEIVALPSLRLAVGKETVTVKYLGTKSSGVLLAGVLITQDGIKEDLAALRTHVVADRRYRVDETHEVSVRYYPPGDLFAVQDVVGGKSTSQMDFLSLLEREQRLGSMLTRAINLETAWRSADRIVLAVKPEIARRLELGTDGFPVRFLHTGVVSPEGGQGRTYTDLLREVKSQLEYIVNVKPEGPPLIAALRTGLFFGEEFGFEAWGGSWPEFADSVFLLRYDPIRGEFLVRLKRLW